MDVGTVENSLFEIHLLLSTFTGLPDLALERDEAKELSKAIANVQRHYPSLKLMSDKHMAIAALGLTASRIYGKRIAALVISPTAKTPQAQTANEMAAAIVATPQAPADWFANTPPDGHSH